MEKDGDTARDLWLRLLRHRAVLEADKRVRNKWRRQSVGEALASGVLLVPVDISSDDFRGRFANEHDRAVFDRLVLITDAWQWDADTGSWKGVRECPTLPERPPRMDMLQSTLVGGRAQAVSSPVSGTVLDQVDQAAREWGEWIERMRNREEWAHRQSRRGRLLAEIFVDTVRASDKEGARLRARLQTGLPDPTSRARWATDLVRHDEWLIPAPPVRAA